MVEPGGKEEAAREYALVRQVGACGVSLSLSVVCSPPVRSYRSLVCLSGRSCAVACSGALRTDVSRARSGARRSVVGRDMSVIKLLLREERW